MPDGIDQFPAFAPLGNKGSGIRQQYTQAPFRPGQGGEQHDHGLAAGTQAGNEGEAVLAAELDIEHDDVRLQMACQFERVAAAAGGPGEVEKRRLAADQRTDTGKDGEYLVKGKRVTGFTNGEEAGVELTEVVPFLLEDRLRERGGQYSKGADWKPYVQVDGLLVTGQNPASSEAAAEELLKLLRG